MGKRRRSGQPQHVKKPCYESIANEVVLPLEMWEIILGKLSFADQQHARLVCKNWNRLIPFADSEVDDVVDYILNTASTLPETLDEEIEEQLRYCPQYSSGIRFLAQEAINHALSVADSRLQYLSYSSQPLTPIKARNRGALSQNLLSPIGTAVQRCAIGFKDFVDMELKDAQSFLNKIELHVQASGGWKPAKHETEPLLVLKLSFFSGENSRDSSIDTFLELGIETTSESLAEFFRCGARRNENAPGSPVQSFVLFKLSHYRGEPDLITNPINAHWRSCREQRLC